MGRAPCCDKANVKKGPWSPEEDAKLKEFIEKHGTGGNWIALPHKAGLKRCGKSCRLRWLNYLRPNIKHGEFSEEEDRIICSIFANIGSRWSIIAAQLPGRTDNDIKNYWNTKLKKKLLGIPTSSQRKTQQRHHQPPPQSSQQPHDQQFFPSSFDCTITTLQTSPPSATCSGYTASVPPQEGALPPGMECMIPLGSDLLGMVAAADSLLPTPPAAAHHYPMKDSRSNSSGFLLFGGEQQSCSSSDASCPQIGYGREMEYELGVEALFYGGGMGDDAHEKLFYGGPAAAVGVAHQMAKAVGGCTNIWGYEAPVDYAALDDIKQLIAAPGTAACNNYYIFSGDGVPGGAILGSPRPHSGTTTTTGLIS